MTPMQLINAYALPCNTDWTSLYEAVARGGAMACLMAYSIDARESGYDALADILSPDHASTLQHDDLWSPFFSRCFPFSNHKDADRHENALQLALLLFAKGIHKPLSAQYHTPTAIVLQNRVYEDVIGFEIDDRTAIIEIRKASTKVVERETATALAQTEPPPKNTDSITLLGGRDLPRCWRVQLPIDRRGIDIAISSPTRVQLVNAALDILRGTGHYYEWVRPMIRYIVPVHAQGGQVFSGSVDALPGLVYATCDGDKLSLAETLVHEASHQRFYQIHSIQPLYDSSSSWTSWSPFTQSQRPASGLLLALHAFVNVVGFYAAMMRRLSDTDQHFTECQNRIEQTTHLLDECLQSLSECPSLTPTGEKFLERLVEARYIADSLELSRNSQANVE